MDLQHAFIGLEEMTVDVKGRVAIPACFMKPLRLRCPERPDTVGLMVTPDRSIKIVPANQFEQEIARLSRLNDRRQRERIILGMSTMGAGLTALDKQNRIKINPAMRKLCGIDRVVMFQGTVNYVQIFDEQRYYQLAENRFDAWSEAEDLLAGYFDDEPSASGPTPPEEPPGDAES